MAAPVVVLERSYQYCLKIGLCPEVTKVAIFGRGVQAVKLFLTLAHWLRPPRSGARGAGACPAVVLGLTST
jgi:hypothetical protein